MSGSVVPLPLAEKNRARPRILSVDDTPDIHFALGEILGDVADLMIAGDGAEAMRLLERQTPDLILLDIMMPGIDGLEVCRRIKADPRLAQIPLIFMTALGEQNAEIQGLTLGAVDYFRKPLHGDLVRQRVLNHLEREHLRQALSEQNAQLEQQVRQRTLSLQIAKEAAESANLIKTAILRNMNHEFRTPLNGVLGMLTLALEFSKEPRVRRYLEHASGAAERLNAVLTSFIDLAATESGQMEIDHRAFLVSEVFDLIGTEHSEAAANKHLNLFLMPLSEDLNSLRLVGDAPRIGQIVNELISNAIKFSTRGTVTVLARVEQGRDVSRLCIDVADEGKGLSKDEMARVFTAFHQEDASETRREGGNGIGLSLCDKLARLMGGELRVASQPGAGSCFSLVLPLQIAKQDTPDNLPDELAICARLRASHGGTRVLAVDDDLITLALIREILDRAGIEVVTVADGEAALAEAERSHFDLFLLDLMLPRLSGLDVARALRRQAAYQRTPMIALTALAESADFSDSQEAGINVHVPKPFSRAVLLELVLRCLDKETQAAGSANQAD